jgi:K+-transporting ATPase ATPase A chain
MALLGWLQIALTLLIAFLISIPVGRYLAKIFTDQRNLVDPLFDPIDNFLYRLIGRKVVTQPMNWKLYTVHMLATNMIMTVLVFLILVFQDHLPLNPMHFGGVEPLLAFNTAISFMTNTDWQTYGGETTMSNFWQGTPQTLDASVTAHPIQGGEQVISIGPVASWETIKHFGTNGGGFFNTNAAHPYENPTPLSNLVLVLMMMILPSALVVCFGRMIGKTTARLDPLRGHGRTRHYVPATGSSVRTVGYADAGAGGH